MATPEWLEGLDSNWQNFAHELADYAYNHSDRSLEESQELAHDFSEAFQDLYDRYDEDKIDFDQLTEEWYEIYDELYEEYDIDLHDGDFYSSK